MTLTIQGLAWGHPVPGGAWRQLFQNFSLACPAGQFVVVIGSNGSGKSTLLNLIAGTLRAGGGSVQLEGRELLGLPDHRRARARNTEFADALCAGRVGAVVDLLDEMHLDSSSSTPDEEDETGDETPDATRVA